VEQLADIATRILSIRFMDVVDIMLVAGLIYAMLYAVRGTRAVQLLRGILLLILVIFLITQIAALNAFTWLISVLLPALIIAVPVIFQPELRRALERLGRAGLVLSRSSETSAADSMVTVVSLAVRQLAANQHGALILLERETGLDDLAERGVPLDAVASVDLIVQIFHPNTPLHDGAIILREGRVLAASVVLPLGETRSSARGLGTRHLAALATSEATDAVAVVVSEETGTISVAHDGELLRHLDEGELSRLLYRLSIVSPTPAERLFAPLVREASRGLRGVTDASRFPLGGSRGRRGTSAAGASGAESGKSASPENTSTNESDEDEPADDAERLLSAPGSED
jgi:uncharacterized protein (TIGR00159 family)